MNILVLNGSPRINGNTAYLTKAFKAGAESKGHTAEIIPIAEYKITGCLGCEHCHEKGEGCIQKDGMQDLYSKLEAADMVVLASPIYYWSLSGHMQNVITRFYAPRKPAADKYALVLSSESSEVYDAPISQYKSMLSYFGAKDLGIKTFAGNLQQNEENYKEMFDFGASL